MTADWYHGYCQKYRDRACDAAGPGVHHGITALVRFRPMLELKRILQYDCGRRYAGGSYAASSSNCKKKHALYFYRGGCVADVRECHPFPTGTPDSVSTRATISNRA